MPAMVALPIGMKQYCSDAELQKPGRPIEQTVQCRHIYANYKAKHQTEGRIVVEAPNGPSRKAGNARRHKQLRLSRNTRGNSII